MKIAELGAKLGLDIVGDDSRDITSPATLVDADEHCVSFFHKKRYRAQLIQTKAAAVILSADNIPDGAKFTAIVSKNPLNDFRRAIEILVPEHSPKAEISDSASIAEQAQIGKDVRIEHFAVIGKAKIGDGTIISAGAVIGNDVVIGKNCRIYPRVVIYDGVKIGNSVIVHAGAVLGSDGFGYSETSDGVFHKIPQIGCLIIENDVEIGANTTIDRGSLGNTVISRGTKIDNLVQIAHNVILGQNCALAAQSGIAGSCKLGKHVLLGGQAGLAGHLELGDGVIVYAQSGVDKSFDDGKILLGSPAREARETMRQQAALAKLPDLMKKTKATGE